MRRLPDFLTAVRVANSRLRLLFGIGLPLGELTRGELPQRDGLPTSVPPGGCATAHARLRDQVRQYVKNPPATRAPPAHQTASQRVRALLRYPKSVLFPHPYFPEVAPAC